jgi:2-hydroxy-3-keto-5-methylthiopentenyl-1-phosphate phosphatase
MDKFAPSEWISIKDKILYERTITLKDGIEMLFNLIESSKKEEIIEYIKKEVQLRDGFSDFIDYCKENNIEFNVLSGGLDFHIDPILKDFKSKIKIYCSNAKFDSEKIKIDYPYLPKNCTLCGDCGCCKIELIEKYPTDRFYRVVIGDSLTDFPPSKVSDIVFARGDLIKYLDEENEDKKEKIKYISFDTFYDIKNGLEKIIGEEKLALN